MFRFALYLALFLLTVVGSTTAHAQDCTHWLNASDGNDNNPGTLTQPVRSMEDAFNRFPDGAIVCMAAGEYFYGDDADGVQLAVADKNMTFRLTSFAGASEIRLSEQEFLVDLGNGVARIENGDADLFMLGSGIVNSDSPSEPTLLNFAHSLQVLSGTLDIDGIALTLEPSVGNPDWVNPDNNAKTAPESAAIRIGNGTLIGSLDYASGPRTIDFRPGIGIEVSSAGILPASLTDFHLNFRGEGTTRLGQEADLSESTVSFSGSPGIVFEQPVRWPTAPLPTLGQDFSGSIQFLSDLIVAPAGPADWFISGEASVHASLLVLESGSLNVDWESAGTLQLDAYASGNASPTPKLALSIQSGSALLGNGNGLMLNGRLENAASLSLNGDVTLDGTDATLLNTGTIDIGASSLSIAPESGKGLIDNPGVISSSGGQILIPSGASLRTTGTGRIMAPWLVHGIWTHESGLILDTVRLPSGVLEIPVDIGGFRSLQDVVAGSTSRISLEENASLEVNGSLELASGTSVDLPDGALLIVDGDAIWPTGVIQTDSGGIFSMTGQGVSLLLGETDGNLILDFSGSDVLIHPSSHYKLPALDMSASTLTWETSSVEASPSFSGPVTLNLSTLNVTSPSDITFDGPVSSTSGSSINIDAPGVRLAADWDFTGTTVDLNEGTLFPIGGSTIRITSDAPIVLPALSLAFSSATVILEGLLDLDGDLELTGGEILITSGSYLSIAGNLTGGAGNFEPVDGGFLIMDGTSQQVVSGFGASVLPSILIDASSVVIEGNSTVFGDLTINRGVVRSTGATAFSVDGSLTQSGGSLVLDEGAQLLVTGDWILDNAELDLLNGGISVGGNVDIAPTSFDASSLTFRAVSNGQTIWRSTRELNAKSLRVSNDLVTLTGSPWTISDRVTIDSGSNFRLDGTDVDLQTGAGNTGLVNHGSIGGKNGWVRIGSAVQIEGSGSFGALRVELPSDATEVTYVGSVDPFRIAGSVEFLSGGLEIGNRSVVFEPDLFQGSIPEILVNLGDTLDPNGIPDGKGFLNGDVPASIAPGSQMNLRLYGAITSLLEIEPWLAGSHVQDLMVEAADPVNDPPIFGVRLSGSSSISGKLTVAVGSVMRIESGSLTLTGTEMTHNVNGIVSGSGSLRLAGSGSGFLSPGQPENRIAGLDIIQPVAAAPSSVSGLARIDRFRLISGSILMSGRAVRIQTSATIESGALQLQTPLILSEGATMLIQGGHLNLNTGSRITVSDGVTLEVDASAQVTSGNLAPAVLGSRDGVVEFKGNASLKAPGGLPRVRLDSETGEGGATDVSLGADLQINELLEIVNGNLLVGPHQLTITGAQVGLDTDGSFDSNMPDIISGDFSGSGGTLRVEGGSQIWLGGNMDLASIDVVVAAGDDQVVINSLTGRNRTVTITNRRLTLQSGSLSLQGQDVVLNGTQARVLDLTGGDVVSASSGNPIAWPGAMDEINTRSSIPYDDDLVGEIVLRGGGSSSIRVQTETSIPHLRISGTVRLEAGSAPLRVSSRFVYGEGGASLVVENGASWMLGAKGGIIRRGSGTLSIAPTFDGQASVIYDLDDGSVTGNASGFSDGRLLTGLELPPTDTKLSNLIVLAGNSASGINSLRLNTDVVVDSMLAVLSGSFDLNGRELQMGNGSLLAIDQVDAQARGRLTGGSPSPQGSMDLSLAARFSNVDVTEELVGTLDLGDVSFHIGRASSSVSRSIRLTTNLTARSLTAFGAREGDALRIDGVDLNLVEELELVFLRLTSSQLASVITHRLNVDAESSVEGPIRIDTDGAVMLRGPLEVLSLDVAGTLDTNGNLRPGVTLLFDGTDQTWFLENDESLGSLRLDQETLSTLRLTSDGVPRTVSINGALFLNQGILATGENVLRLDGVAPGFLHTAAEGAISHVTGNIQFQVEEGTQPSLQFPVGTSSLYTPLTVAFSQAALSSSMIRLSLLESDIPDRSGFPIDAGNGVALMDSAPFWWELTSSVNFAQSQPVDITASLSGPIAGSNLNHRLLAGSTSNTPWVPWSLLPGTQVVTTIEDALLIRSLDARGLLTPSGYRIGIGVDSVLLEGEMAIQWMDVERQGNSSFFINDTYRFSSTTSVPASPLTAFGFDPATAQPLSIQMRRGGSVVGADLDVVPENDLSIAVLGTKQGLIPVNLSAFRRDSGSQEVQLQMVHARSTVGEVDLSTEGFGLPVALATDLAPYTASDVFVVSASAQVFTIDDGYTTESVRLDLSGLGGQSGIIYLLAHEGIINTLFFAGSNGTVRNGTVVTNVDEGVGTMPGGFHISGNYPNPFYGRTQLVLDVPEPGLAELEAVDVLGRRVLRERLRLEAGWGTTLELDAESLAAGTYFYRILLHGRTRHVATGSLTVLR